MKYSFATLGCPAWSLEHIAEQAAQMGYDAVDLRTSADRNHIRPDEPAADCRQIKELFAGRGVGIACLMGYTNFATASEEDRRKSQATCQSLIATAAALGCPRVRIFGGDAKDTAVQVMIDRVVGAIKDVLPAAEKAGVQLVFETHDAWCDPKNLMQVMDRLPSASLGICWDIANSAPLLPHRQAYEGMKSRISHIHAKDVAKLGEHAVVLAGQGQARLAEAFGLLKAGGYAGTIAYEWEKKWQPTIPEPEVAFPQFLEFAKKIA